MEAAKPDSPLGLTVEQAFGETLRYDYGVLDSGRHFTLDVTFRPGEIHWHELRENGNTETDPTQVVLLDEHRMLASWPEENGWFVVLYADFSSGGDFVLCNKRCGRGRVLHVHDWIDHARKMNQATGGPNPPL